jgi:hypothetical protein
MTLTPEQLPDEAEYVTRVDVNLAILREMAKIRFKERLPLIMGGVAKELLAAGVDFTKAELSQSPPLSEEEWDAVYEDLK